jgi:hypothetical protein
MQLTYRGIQHNNTSTALFPAPQGTAIYRGVTYSILPSHSATTLTAMLKYRGIAYAQTGVKPPEVTYQPGSRPAMA